MNKNLVANLLWGASWSLRVAVSALVVEAVAIVVEGLWLEIGLLEIGAAVVPHEGEELAPGEVSAYVKERIAAYKYPRLVEFVDTLPKTVSGKIRRVELRARARTAELERLNEAKRLFARYKNEMGSKLSDKDQVHKYLIV